jgi:hypothetical protein
MISTFNPDARKVEPTAGLTSTLICTMSGIAVSVMRWIHTQARPPSICSPRVSPTAKAAFDKRVSVSTLSATHSAKARSSTRVIARAPVLKALMTAAAPSATTISATKTSTSVNPLTLIEGS